MRVIPPLTTIAAATDDVFLSITPTMLSASSVVETAPAAYSGGTTYGEGDQASDLSANLILVYESLQPGNTGHTPESSPDWWRLVGTTYPEYAGGATYAQGDHVIQASAHMEYESLVGSNMGNALTDTTKWLAIGPTNRFRAFNLLRSTGTTSPSTQVHEVTPGSRVNAIGLVGLVAQSITVEVIVDSEVVWTISQSLSVRVTTTWSEYFFGGFLFKDRIALFNLPPLSGATVRITLERPTGDVTCGRMILGQQVYLGEVETGADDDELNFSTVDRDFDGSTVLIPRRSVTRFAATVWCMKARVRRARELRKALNATPAIWVGLQDTTDGYYESLLVLGVHKRFTFGLVEYNEARISLEVEEA